MAQSEASLNIVYQLRRKHRRRTSQADEITLADMEASAPAHVVEVRSPNTCHHIVCNEGKPVALVGSPRLSRNPQSFIIEGRFFDDLDQATGAKGCLITQELAKQLPPGPMIGRQLRVGEQTFTVIAVFRER